MKEKVCGVYLITNNLNGMSYVGQSVNCMQRWSSHKSPSANNSPIDKAIKEYCIENFTFKIEKVCSPEELDFYEKETIKKYNTVWPNGYNMLSGGKKGFDTCKETRRRKSESAKIKPPVSNETKKKISEFAKTRTGEKNSFYNHHHTEEVRRKISQSNKGRKSWNKGGSTPKLKWITPGGEIKYMDKSNAGRWHPDWILIEKDL